MCCYSDDIQVLCVCAWMTSRLYGITEIYLVLWWGCLLPCIMRYTGNNKPSCTFSHQSAASFSSYESPFRRLTRPNTTYSLQNPGLSWGSLYRHKLYLTLCFSGFGKLELDLYSHLNYQVINTYPSCEDWGIMGFNLTLPAGLFVVLINPRPLLFQTHSITLFPQGLASALINILEHSRQKTTPVKVLSLILFFVFTMVMCSTEHLYSWSKTMQLLLNTNHCGHKWQL